MMDYGCWTKNEKTFHEVMIDNGFCEDHPDFGFRVKPHLVGEVSISPPLYFEEPTGKIIDVPETGTSFPETKRIPGVHWDVRVSDRIAAIIQHNLDTGEGVLGATKGVEGNAKTPAGWRIKKTPFRIFLKSEINTPSHKFEGD